MAASRCGLTPVLSCRASEVYQLLTRAAGAAGTEALPAGQDAVAAGQQVQVL